MSDIHGSFIVIEGLDGAGTTTQATRLARRFASTNLPVFSTFEPTPEPIGALIRRILDGSEKYDNAPYRPGEAALALLFAADRLAHSTTIFARLQEAHHVICDRYVLSSMAYQSLGKHIDGTRVVDLNRGCTRPDLTILIEVPVGECLRRLADRGGADSIYERRDLLERIAANYRQLGPLYRESFGRLEAIDGTRNEDAVHRAIVKLIRRHTSLNI